MKIGILGGTGIEGKGLALRFASAGVGVVLGSRSSERAATVATEYNSAVGTALVEGRSNLQTLALTDVVFLTVPFNTVLDAIASCRGGFRPGQILVDVTVPITFESGRPELVEPDGTSHSELIARHVPSGVTVAAAFKTIPAHILGELKTELRCDEFVCSDSMETTAEVMKTAALIPTLRLVDAGPLASAAILDHMTLLAVRLNRRYKRKGARFAVQGI